MKKKTRLFSHCRGICHKTIDVMKNDVEPKAMLVKRKIEHSLLPLESRLIFYQY
jgi:hypothetical protein